MIVQTATPEEIVKWNELLTSNPDGGNVFQMTEMVETKRRSGWTPKYLRAGNAAVTVLEKHVPLLGKYWYLPKGPGVTSVPALRELMPELQQYANESGVFALKIEPEIIESDETVSEIAELGYTKTAPVQPNVSTVLIDLSLDLDQVMTSLNQKGRHAIRRAERDGVMVSPVDMTDDNMRMMYELLRSTAEGRFESSIRDYEYYKSYWTAFSSSGHGQLFFARFEGKLVAAAYCMFLGTKGLYKDGASIREKTAYGASHLLQWEAMKWMKARGVTSYDLCGAPHSSQINDESHKFYGVGRFKTSFNKHVTDYIGCYDVVISTSKYRLWQKIFQRVVVSYEWRLKHRQWY